MERVIFITKINQLKYVTSRFSRLYFGIEFCERLIPSLDDLKKMLCYIQRKGLNISLVSPYVTNIGLGRLKTLFEFLKSEKINCEVIINDWGVLNLINRKYPNLTPVLGRLLTKQKRCPRLIRLLKRQLMPRLIVDSKNPDQRHIFIPKILPLDLDSYYKGSDTSSVPVIHNFLIGQRIKRIELDNTAQGLLLELPRDKISASIYLPYVYISTTFFCPTAGCDLKKAFLLKIKSCKKQCQKYVFKLRHRTMPKIIYLKGNTQFYKNARLRIGEFAKIGIDRIVYQPQLPI